MRPWKPLGGPKVGQKKIYPPLFSIQFYKEKKYFKTFPGPIRSFAEKREPYWLSG